MSTHSSGEHDHENEREYENLLSSELILGLSPSDMIPDNSEAQFKLEEKIKRRLSEVQDMEKEKKEAEPQKQKLKEKIEKLINKYKSAKLVRLSDELMFVFGLCRLLAEAYLLGKSPCSYPLFYSIFVLFLVFIRFFYYRYMKWHYFLLDFCYWANLLLIVFLWIFPESEFLFISTYAFSMGPLLIAVPIFRNSMVLHSLEKQTSVFIHLAPPIVMWSLRYNECECWSISKTTPPLTTYLKNTLILYFVWAVVYYFIIFKLTFERCEKKNNTTLFRYHMENKDGFFYKLTGILGEKLRPVSFMSTHVIFSIITLLITYITLYSQIIQLIFIGFSILQTFWSAATYYMEIFSKNYELRLQQLESLKTTLSTSDNKKNN